MTCSARLHTGPFLPPACHPAQSRKALQHPCGGGGVDITASIHSGGAWGRVGGLSGSQSSQRRAGVPPTGLPSLTLCPTSWGARPPFQRPLGEPGRKTCTLVLLMLQKAVGWGSVGSGGAWAGEGRRREFWNVCSQPHFSSCLSCFARVAPLHGQRKCPQSPRTIRRELFQAAPVTDLIQWGVSSWASS